MEAVRPVFETYARFGGDAGGGGPQVGMTSRNFVKLAKDTGIVNKKITLTVLDLSFTKAARAQAGTLDTSWGGKRINFEQFLIALGHCAEAGGVSPDALVEKVAAAGAGGPKVNNVTQAGGGAAKFYDDKSSWTKTAKNGGPTKIDGGAGDKWSKSLN